MLMIACLSKLYYYQDIALLHRGIAIGSWPGHSITVTIMEHSFLDPFLT